MWVDLISMTATGVLAACLVFILGRVLRRTGQKLPRWAMPAAIGAAMLTFTVWNEYSWFDRMQSALSDNVVVLGTGQRTAPWAPWTYAVPVTVRFVAMDTEALQWSQERSDLVRAQLLLVERWQPTRVVPVAFDCAARLRADLIGGAQLSPDGTLTGARWKAVDADEAGLKAACDRA